MTAQMTAQMTAPLADQLHLPLEFDDAFDHAFDEAFDRDRSAAAEVLAVAPRPSVGAVAHAELADLLLDPAPALAPWNRERASRPAAPRPERVRHLHLVTDAPVARRHPVRALLAGLGLAALVALASIGVLAFLGADAAASTPASSTGATPPAAAVDPAPVAVAEPAPQWIVVQSGDSLWTLARRMQPKGDVRRLVDRLAERVGPSVNAGQRIDVRGLVD